MKKYIFTLIALIIVLAMLVGCGGQTVQTTTSAQTTAAKTTAAQTTAEQTSAAPAATTAKVKYKVDIIFADLSNTVWAELVQEAKRYGENDLKNMTVTYYDSQSDATKQVTQIENSIQGGANAIIVCAVEANAIKDVTQKAMDKGIKVVSYTQVIANCDAEYLVDPYNTGYACGKRAAQWINENYPNEATVEWALMDLPQFPEIIERANGIKAGVADNAKNAKLVATASALTISEGVANAENFTQAHPNLKVICCIGGGGSAGGNEGLKSFTTDYKSVGLFGIDATKPEIQAILNGEPEKSSISLGGGKAHAKVLIDLADSLLQGKEIKKTNYMVPTVIDSSNVQKYWDDMYATK